jgi:UDP-glucose 4-epimerase
MRVLVTGGSGFIGSHVVDRLQARGVEPRILDLAQSPHHRAGEVETVLGDLCDRDTALEALRGCDAVIHLAALADVDQVTKDPGLADRVNVRGTQTLLDAARELELGRFVYASTIWVYGDAAGPEAVDEDTPLGLPKHFYTATKIAGEMYCSAYTELYGLDHTILRFGIPYGPRSRPTAVVAAFTAKALAGQPLTIAGDGTQSRRFVYVEDLADGVAASLDPVAANRVYNLVGRENTSVRSIARTVRDVVGDVPIVHIEGRAGDLKGGNISGERAAAELGWEPTTAFAEGVRRYVDWVTDDAGMPRVATASSTDGSAAAVLRQESAEL